MRYLFLPIIRCVRACALTLTHSLEQRAPPCRLGGWRRVRNTTHHLLRGGNAGVHQQRRLGKTRVSHCRTCAHINCVVVRYAPHACSHNVITVCYLFWCRLALHYYSCNGETSTSDVNADERTYVCLKVYTRRHLQMHTGAISIQASHSTTRFEETKSRDELVAIQVVEVCSEIFSVTNSRCVCICGPPCS
jgi:hypothetical protein